MPKYKITAPDGKAYVVTAPDGATQEQVLAYAQQHYGQQSAPEQHTQQSSAAADPTEGMSTLDKLRAGVGKSFVDTGRGLEQISVGLGSLLPSALGGDYYKGQSERLKQEQTQVDQRDAPLMATTAGTVGNVIGQTAQAAIPVGEVAVAGKAAPLVKAALSGGAYAAAQPVAESESRLQNTAAGALAGVAGQGAASGLKKAATAAKPALSEATQRGIQVLRDAGVPLHFSQLTNSKFAKTLASAASYLPFSGSGAAKDAQQAGFNRALSKTIGQDAKSLTPEVISKASDDISKQYDALFARNKVNIDPQDVSRLVGLARQAASDLPPDQAKVVQNQIGKYINAAADNDGHIPGRLYQNIRATLMPLESQQPSGHLVGQVRKAMQDAANKSFGHDDAKELKALNGKFSNLKIIKKALDRVSGADNNVHPAQLWSLVNGKYGATPEMRALARAGQTVLKDPIPDSGTAARSLIYSGLGLGGALHPAGISQLAALTATGATVGRALNSQAAAKLLPGSGAKVLGGLAALARPAPVLVPAVVRAEKRK